MEKIINSITIVGGGAAGWITAGIIAAKHRLKRNFSVRLVESPDMPTIGVGEGTWPTMRLTLKAMGVSEMDFLRECDASFKQGTKFVGWATGASNDIYYHPFTAPQGFQSAKIARHWLEGDRGLSFCDATCVQVHFCERNLGPKKIGMSDYACVANHAYHLDAGKFSSFLKRHCIDELGVEHISDKVTKVNAAENGDIASVSTENNGDIEGDIFIDCTGFRSILLGGHYGVDFIDRSDVLFIDRALAVQVPYENENTPILSQTLSTAQEAGWIWDIGLANRRGVGHVYSSRHQDDARAEAILRQYLSETASGPDKVEVRSIKFRPGHRAQFWRNNCVAVGMSSGFLEPLEASALVLVELLAKDIAEQLPATRGLMDIVANRFNTKFLHYWDRVVDFLKLHYVLTQRSQSAFWRDNCDPATIPESLREQLKIWEYNIPSSFDSHLREEIFSAASVQYILYGMGFKTDISRFPKVDAATNFAQQQFDEVQKNIERFVPLMPTNRDLLNHIHANH